jgi:hypothetical protein
MHDEHQVQMAAVAPYGQERPNQCLLAMDVDEFHQSPLRLFCIPVSWKGPSLRAINITDKLMVTM